MSDREPDYPCICCTRNVRPRQEAVQCERCDRWQHRTCNTGIDRATYRRVVNEQENLEWACEDCTNHQETMDTTGPEDGSFDTSATFVVPNPVMEESLDDEAVVENSEDDGEDVQVSYAVIENGSTRGKPKLTDNLGFSYVVKRKRLAKDKTEKTDWQCSERGKHSTRCPATVVQHCGDFTPGPGQHNHASQPGLETKIKVTAQVKSHALQHVFQSARSVVDMVLTEHREATINQPEGSRPRTANLIRMANRAKQKLRPSEPKDIDFELATDFIPEGFLQDDIQVDGARHMIFAIPDQLRILSRTKTWYLDGTFKVVRPPFYQLFSVHGFIRSGESAKQVPLVFILMSRRQTKDYWKVLQHLQELLPSRPNVQVMVTDFEKAIWKGIRKTFPTVSIRGCVFHLTQAIWRKIQEIGLQVANQQHDKVHKFLRKVMALAFLPAEHIEDAFYSLATYARTAKTQELMQYVEDTWITSTFWPTECWSVFEQPTRTNNDCEGWHRRLNEKAGGGNLPFYVLLPLLHAEANRFPLQVLLVSEKKLSRYQRQNTKCKQAELFALWTEYKENNLTLSQLLRECAELNGPIV